MRMMLTRKKKVQSAFLAQLICIQWRPQKPRQVRELRESEMNIERKGRQAEVEDTLTYFYGNAII